MIIKTGIPAEHRAQATALYWDAFGAKLNVTMGPKEKAQVFIENVLDPSHGICALDDDGALLGVVGFKTNKSALVDGSFADLRYVYGIFGATWRAAFLNLLERDTEDARFLMDGIFVAPYARGRGVGTALLNAIFNEAKARGYAQVRLDVIDSNPRARALYEREGFKAIKTQSLGPLRYIFGFRASTTMVRAV